MTGSRQGPGATFPRRPLPRIDTPTPASLSRVAEALAGQREVWQRIASREEGAFSTRLAMGPSWEAWLQGWPPGHRSGLHDHGVSSGALVVVRGELDEVTLLTPRGAAGPARTHRRRLRGRRLRAFGGDLVHDLSNPGPRPAVSLHVVGPVPAAAAVYEVDDAGELRPTGTTGVGAGVW